MMPPVWKDFAVGLSLANISYLRAWSEMLTYKRENTFWMKHPPTPTELAAVMLNVLLLGLAIGGAVVLARRHAGPLLRKWLGIVFLLFLAVPFNALRSVLDTHIPRLYFLGSPLFELIGQRGVLLLALALAASGLLAIAFWSSRLVQAAAAALLLLSPFVIITFGQAIWAATRYDGRSFVDKPLAPALPIRPGAARVLWIIFDEMDQRLAFRERDPSLKLAELDRLRAQALFAANAYPPGPETQVSLPGYITGRSVTDYHEAGPADLTLKFADSTQQVRWSDQPSVFARARQAGFNTAVVGWFHPYCRVLNTSLTACDWWPLAMQYNSMGSTLRDLIPNQTRSLFETTLFSPFGQSLSAKAHARTYGCMLARARQVATDPKLGFSLLHLPVPHAPHVYDRSTGRFTRKNSPIDAYLDSLALADRTLGELRRAMETAQMWDSTTVLISSDHHYRESAQLDGKDDLRVPFILKLAGQTEGFTYQQAFNTVLTQQLLLGILQGEVNTPQQAALWLDTHRGEFPAP